MTSKTILKDVQSLNDERGIDIQKVGIKNVELPLTIQRKNDSNQTVYAMAQVSVDLPKKYKGTHMSRFMEILTKWSQKNLLSEDINGFLTEVQKKLSAHSAEVSFQFKYFINKIAPVSKIVSQQGYDCLFKGVLQGNNYKFFLSVKVPVTTLCPCSKEISDYSAHNQRAVVDIMISYPDTEQVWLEDLIKMAETSGSCEVYPLLKRSDEKYVTEKAYNNPKFVEDVIRDIVLKLRENKIINYFEVEVESFESIHNHSAWAYQKEIKMEYENEKII